MKAFSFTEHRIKYLENLSVLANYIRYSRNGGWQENPEVLVLETRRRRCNYDLCPNKKKPSDALVRKIWDNGNFHEQSFHSSCIEMILKDQRLDSVN
ncbi:hypothetical protein HYV50_00585 [Candidatus Pacearchaeota archaeon]|nr:hypothetical protein [Candidatus Pacearchaeota archaeon]